MCGFATEVVDDLCHRTSQDLVLILLFYHHPWDRELWSQILNSTLKNAPLVPPGTL